MSYQASFLNKRSERYSIKKTAKPVNFVCNIKEAKSVFVIGEFNQWNPVANPMQKQPDGVWTTQIPIVHGHHRYLLLVDGQKMLDPRAQGVTTNEKKEKVSLLAVS